MPPTRIIHFSDVHWNIPNPGWRPADFLSKRLTGWVNWNLTPRGRKFADAGRRIRAIGDFIRDRKPDGVVFSGDASAIGFGSEAHAVAQALGDIDVPKIAVPGNHDYYTRSGVKAQGFESAFASWQQGQRTGPEKYPFAVRFGAHWFVGVNSSRANWLPLDAHGEVDAPQLQRLDQLLHSLPDEPRVLVTHYPFCKSDGQRENRWHGLRNRDALKEIVLRHGVRAWLCGHIHRPFLLEPTADQPIFMSCGGSATQEHRASIFEITFDDNRTSVKRYPWNNDRSQYSEPFV